MKIFLLCGVALLSPSGLHLATAVAEAHAEANLRFRDEDVHDSHARAQCTLGVEKGDATTDHPANGVDCIGLRGAARCDHHDARRHEGNESQSRIGADCEREWEADVSS